MSCEASQGHSLYALGGRDESRPYVTRLHRHKISGGHGAGATPDPIPNSEVKPGNADDTAYLRGKVGRRRSLFHSKARLLTEAGFFLLGAGVVLGCRETYVRGNWADICGRVRKGSEIRGKIGGRNAGQRRLEPPGGR